MNPEEAFINKHAGNWQQLEEYNNRLLRAKRCMLSSGEIKEYAALYRATGHHLAYAKTYFPNSKCVMYLNQLLGVSHTCFYKRQKTVFHDIAYYFAAGFPTQVRKNMKYILASVSAFLVGALLILVLANVDGTYIFYFLSEEIVESNNITGQLSDETWLFPYLSAYIMTNNIRVAALAIAYGVAFGVGTIWVLLLNGLSIGAFYAMVILYGMDQTRFWSLILPHGVIELTAIFIAGAAGLIIGRGMLVPNELPRAHSFVKSAKEAFYLLPGITVMLIIAGIIEGFFTPLDIPEMPKLIFAFFTLVMLVVYLGLCGAGKKANGLSKKLPL